MMNEALIMRTASKEEIEERQRQQLHLPTLEDNIIVPIDDDVISEPSFDGGEEVVRGNHFRRRSHHERQDDDAGEEHKQEYRDQYEHDVGKQYRHNKYNRGDDEELATAEDLGVIFELIERREWDEMTSFLQALPEAAAIFMAPRSAIENNSNGRGDMDASGDENGNKKGPILWTCSMASTMSAKSPTATPSRRRATSKTQQAQNGGNLALHVACKYQPPVRAIQALVDAYKDAVKVPGLYGLLPLHFAVSSNASEHVVRLLIEAYPGAVRVRDELDDALPIHLAAKWGANDEVLLDILTAHPEGSFMQDASGKTAMDHAKRLPPEVALKNNVITVLQIAPILAKAAECAKSRLQQDYDTKKLGYEQAQKEFVRQLNDRFDEERAEFLHKEIGFNTELANEKEANITLHEELTTMKQKASSYKDERDDLHELLAKERAEHHRKIDEHDQECKLAVEETKERMKQLEKHIETMKYMETQAAAGNRRYDEIEKKLSMTKTELQHKDETIRHLHSLLSTKDERIEELEERCSEMEVYHNETASYCARDISSMDQYGAEEESHYSRMEINQLRQLSASQQDELIISRRKIKEMEDRWDSIKGLVSSLSYIVDHKGHDNSEKDSKQSEIEVDSSYRSERNKKLSPPRILQIRRLPASATPPRSSNVSRASPKRNNVTTSSTSKSTMSGGMEHVMKEQTSRVKETIANQRHLGGTASSTSSPAKSKRLNDPGTPDTVVTNYTSLSVPSPDDTNQGVGTTNIPPRADQQVRLEKHLSFDEDERSVEGANTIDTETNTSTVSHHDAEGIATNEHDGHGNSSVLTEDQEQFLENLISNHPPSPPAASSPERSNGSSASLNSYHSTFSTPSPMKSQNGKPAGSHTARENLNVEVQLAPSGISTSNSMSTNDLSVDSSVPDQRSSSLQSRQAEF